MLLKTFGRCNLTVDQYFILIVYRRCVSLRSLLNVSKPEFY
jgi:hypothetical protein